MVNIHNKQQMRATFEDTSSAQEKLRQTLDMLIAENRPLKDDDERKKMFKLYNDCFLGLDGQKVVKQFIMYPSGRCVQVDDYGQMIRSLCYQKDTMMKISFFGDYGDEVIPIRDIWMSVRDIAFSLFPIAIDKAISMSKEIVDNRRQVQRIKVKQDDEQP